MRSACSVARYSWAIAKYYAFVFRIVILLLEGNLSVFMADNKETTNTQNLKRPSKIHQSIKNEIVFQETVINPFHQYHTC